MQDLNPLEWAIRPLKRYAVFSGRAPRAEYWWFTLGTTLIQIPLKLLDSMLVDWEPLSTAFSVAILIPSIAVTVRRLHDTNRSGWWMLAFVGAFALVGVVAAVGALSPGAPTAGSFTGAIVAIVIALFAMITMLVFMVVPGTEGPNRYGPDPYGPDSLEEVFA